MFNQNIKKIIKRVIKKIKIVPKIEGISIEDMLVVTEELIYPEVSFNLSARLDILGREHHYFFGYNCTIPPFYVRSIKNAKCVVGREEIFTHDDRVITDYTSQKVNPCIDESRLKLKNVRKINASIANLSLSGLENNYYHWLTECLGRYYLLEKSKFKPDFYILSNSLSFQKQYIELLGIDENKIIQVDSGIVIQANQLIVPSFINNWEYVDFRGYKHYQKQWLPGWIGNIYQDKIEIKGLENQRNKIYISRSCASYRKVENEHEVVDLLKSKGFGIYHLEKMSIKAQVELFSNASIVLGAHGAGFSNIYFCPKDATICELFSQYYHDSSFKILSNVLGLKYNYIIGKTDSTRNTSPQQENMYIDLRQIQCFIETLHLSG